MIDASIEFPHRDVAALVKQMERARQVLGKSIPASVYMAMTSVLRSLGASTKVAPKHREYTPDEAYNATIQNRDEQGRFLTVERRVKLRYLVKRYRRPHPQIAYAYNEQELLKHKAVIISLRGLAARSWVMAGKKTRISLRGKEGASLTNALASRMARQLVDAESRLSGDDPYMKVRNRVKYITEALVGGPSTVDTAMERAARAMSHNIDKQAARSFGLS